MALTDDAHQLIRDHFDDKDKKVAVDATCGNGHDMQFLAELGFAKVVGFDIQQAAIDASRSRIEQVGLNGVELILAGHESIEQHIDSPVDCIMFNFGYLPNGDKTLTTNADNSVSGIVAATRLLNKSGMISLMCYPGHPSGALETQAIRDYLRSLSNDWTMETHLAVSPKPTAPILYTLKRA